VDGCKNLSFFFYSSIKNKKIKNKNKGQLVCKMIRVLYYGAQTRKKISFHFFINNFFFFFFLLLKNSQINIFLFVDKKSKITFVYIKTWDKSLVKLIGNHDISDACALAIN
jgi:hypothetical protein